MQNSIRRFSMVVFMLLWVANTVWSQSEARLLRFPDINNNLIAFVYAGDIWTVDANGSNAKRITSHDGLELFPKISPDGKWIAFSAEYSGSRQVFVVPATGGKSKQLTYYNSVGWMPPRGGFDDVVLDWTPDSKNILIRANRHPHGDRMGRYFLVNIDGGLETPLPIVEGGFACLSPDAKKICFTPVDREFRTWKRYKGGRATDLWIYDLEKNTSEQITDFAGTDQIPVWHGDKIFFASDRELTLNIFSYDTKSKEVKQITQHTEFDVMWPAGENGMLVYENGGQIYKLNLETGKNEKVTVNISFDNPNTLPYFKNVSSDVHSFAVSPTGKRALFDARGDIFSIPAENGTTENLTNTQGIREISPSWSPDGKYIAYYSDATGEYEIYLLENKKGANARQLTKGSKSWKYGTVWSPNSKWLLFSDRNLNLTIVDAASGNNTVIAKASQNEIQDYSFSPDSKWITYSKESSNGNNAVWVYNIDTKQSNQITDEMFSNFEPVFATDGNYLFFLSNRDFNLEFSAYEFSYLYTNATRMYAVALRKNSPKLFEDKNDTELTESEAPTGDSKSTKKEKKDTNTETTPSNTVNISIDFEGIKNRIISFPISSGNYGGLNAVEGGFLYSEGAKIMRFNVKDNKSETVLIGSGFATISADGKKMMYRTGNDFGIVSISPNQKAGDGKLNLEDMDMKIDPLKEWEQIYNDAWRIFRDYFYVENLHGVDWEAMRKKYAQLLPYVAHRADLDYILGELVAESNTGHAYVDYGDFKKVPRMDNGLLGCEFVADTKAGRYKFSKIFEGENWDIQRRSPLTEIGVDVKVGDYLISINGNDVSTSQNPYQFLENTVGKTIEISVNSIPSEVGARSYFIQPIRSEISLRYVDWVKSRREMVDRLSNGKIGYIHVPNTAVEGNLELFKGMYAFHDKEALIIDDRYNGGGFIPELMADLLDRKTLSYWARKGLDPMKTPAIAHDGPKVMLINGYSSSGGDAFPYYFKKKQLGTLIGTRTWGGLVGISGNARLVDGGYISVPRFGIFDENGEWIIEGIGVYPDIEVVDAPHLLANGKDPSLEKAIEVLNLELAKNPVKKVKQPTDPNRSKWIEKKID